MSFVEVSGRGAAADQLLKLLRNKSYYAFFLLGRTVASTAPSEPPGVGRWGASGFGVLKLGLGSKRRERKDREGVCGWSRVRWPGMRVEHVLTGRGASRLLD